MYPEYATICLTLFLLAQNVPNWDLITCTQEKISFCSVVSFSTFIEGGSSPQNK